MNAYNPDFTEGIHSQGLRKVLPAEKRYTIPLQLTITQNDSSMRYQTIFLSILVLLVCCILNATEMDVPYNPSVAPPPVDGPIKKMNGLPTLPSPLTTPSNPGYAQNAENNTSANASAANETAAEPVAESALGSAENTAESPASGSGSQEIGSGKDASAVKNIPVKDKSGTEPVPVKSDKKEQVVVVKTDTEDPKVNADEQEILKQLATPRRLITFIQKSILQNDYMRGTRAFDFSKFPQLSDAEKKEIVYKFDFILSRIMINRQEDISDEAGSKEYMFQPNSNYPGFEMIWTDDHYLFNESAIKLVTELYEEIRELPPVVSEWSFFTSLSSRWYRIKFGLSYVQWITLFLSIIIGMVAGFIASRLLYLITLTPFKFLQRDHTNFKLSKNMWQPMGWLITYLIWYMTIVVLKLPPAISEVVGYPLRFFAILMCVLTALRLTSFAGELIRVKVQEKFSKIDQILVPLFTRTMKILIICTGVIMTFQLFGFSAVGIISGMGIGGIAIALAAQNTIANFFGSLTVLMDRPFVIGDWIVTSGVEGEVESVGLRSTKIRTFYNSEVIIPNNFLTTAIIDNMGRRHFRRYKTLIKVHYNTPPDRIEAFCEGIRELILSYPNTRKDKYNVDTYELGDSSIDILLNCFFLVPDYTAESKARSVLILDILRLAAQMEVEMAYPTQTLYTTARLEPNYIKGPETTPKEAVLLADDIAEQSRLRRHQEEEEKR